MLLLLQPNEWSPGPAPRPADSPGHGQQVPVGPPAGRATRLGSQSCATAMEPPSWREQASSSRSMPGTPSNQKAVKVATEE